MHVASSSTALECVLWNKRRTVVFGSFSAFGSVMRRTTTGSSLCEAPHRASAAKAAIASRTAPRSWRAFRIIPSNEKGEAQPPQRPSLERDGKRLLTRPHGSGKGSSTAYKLGNRQTVYPPGIRYLAAGRQIDDRAPSKPQPRCLPWNLRRRWPRLSYP